MKTIEISIPGSKSLTNRALIMASLANGVSVIKNCSKSDDCVVMIQALRKLGIVITEKRNELTVIGNNGKFRAFNGRLEVGSSGTATRFLTSLITLVPGQITMIRSNRMKLRPIEELNDALTRISAGKISIRGDISSQFISSLLMIAPVLKKGLVIKITGKLVSRSYVDMTIDLMHKFGIKVVNKKYRQLVIKKGQEFRPITYSVEADASGASYFWAIAAVTGQKIKVNNINPRSLQGDIKFADILKEMGCKVTKNPKKLWIMVEGSGKLNGVKVNMNLMPDTAQTLAVIAAFAVGKTAIVGLSTLKVKETDRLLALKKELSKMKIKSEITKDSIEIEGGDPQKATIETHDDHRMAMAFAVAKSRIPKLIIKNPEVVSKSFPEFWEKFKKI
jgi:3-phosphoshikimate 1-carboxyvinyltransferase